MDGIILMSPCQPRRFVNLIFRALTRKKSVLGDMRSVVIWGQQVITNRAEATQVVRWIADRANREMGISPVATIMEFCCGAANSLDPYSALLTPNQFRDACSLVAGNFVGLGVELKMDSRQLMIVRVISGSPAEKAGILKNDQILSVDGQSVLNMPNDKAASLLQGPEGTEVSLVVQAPNSPPREGPYYSYAC